MKKSLYLILALTLMLGVFTALSAQGYDLLFYQGYYDGGTAATSAFETVGAVDYEAADNFSGLTEDIEQFVFYGLTLKHDGAAWVEQIPAAIEPFIFRFYNYEEGIDPGLTAATTGTYSVELYDDFGDGWNGGLLTVYVNATAVLTGITLDAGYGPATYTFAVNAGDMIWTAYTAGSWAYENYYRILDDSAVMIAEDGGTFANQGASEPTGIPQGGSQVVFEPTWATPLQTINADAAVVNVGSVWSGQYQLYKFTVEFATPVALTDGWISAQIDADNGSGTWFLWLNSLDGDLFAYHRTTPARGPMTRELASLASLSATGSREVTRGPVAYDLALEIWGGVASTPPVATNPNPAHEAVEVPLTGNLSWTGSILADGYYLSLGTVAAAPVWDILNALDIASTSYPYTGLLDFETEYRWMVVPYNLSGPALNPVEWTFTSTPDYTITTFPYLADFEIGAMGWSSGAITGNNHWQLGTPAQVNINSAYSGVNAWMTYLDVNYEINANTWLMSPPLDFSLLGMVMFSAYLNIWTESGWDAMILESSIDGGVTWQKVRNDDEALEFYNSASTSGPIAPPKWSGQIAGGWNQYVTILPGLEGYANVLLRFRFGSDGSVQYEGVAVDDVSIWEPEDVPPLAATLNFPLDEMITFINPMLNWSPSLDGTPATAFKVYLDTDGSFTDPPVYDGPNSYYQTSGLVSGTEYFWKVVPYNTYGDADPVPTWSFNVIAPGYLAESFEVVTPFLPVGWQNPGTWSGSVSYPFHGARTAYKFTSSTLGMLRLVTPIVSIVAGDALDFYARTASANADQRIQIEYSSDGVTWSPIGDPAVLVNAPMVPYSVDLSILAGGDYYLSFSAHTVSTTTGSVYLDYVRGPFITVFPPNAPTLSAPADLATNVSILPALSWTAAATGGIPAGYEIYLSDVELDVINGEAAALLADVPASPYQLTTVLDYETTYYWKVVAYNSLGDAASTIRSFTTMADPTIYPPFTEDFTPTTFPPLNWTRWTGLLEENSVLTSSTIGWARHTAFANDTTHPNGPAARINIWTTTVRYWMVTPPIELGTGTDYWLEFDLALTAYGSANPPGLTGVDDRFAVVVSTDMGVTWSQSNALAIWDNQGSPYVYNGIAVNGERVILDMSGLEGIVLIGFYGESTVSNADNHLHVDNVTVRVAPTAPEFAVTPAEKDFGTVMLGHAVPQQFTISNIGVGQLGITEVSLTGDPDFTLIDTNTYPEYLGALESIEVTVVFTPELPEGPKTATLTITDDQGARTAYPIVINGEAFDPTIYVPHFENFDAVTVPNLPLGWTKIVNSTSIYAYVDVYNFGTPYSNPNHARLTNSADAAAELVLITPLIGDNLSDLRVRFFAKGGTNYSLLVGTMSDTNEFTLVETLIVPGTYTEYTVSFAGYVGTDQKIAFKHGLGGTYRTIYIDNVNIEAIPAQPLLEVAPLSADFSATAGGTSPAALFTLLNQGANTLIINDGDITFTGTNAGDFYVEATYPIELTGPATAQISVFFAPTEEGARVATMEIVHNGSNSPFEIPLTGFAYPAGTVIFGSGTLVNGTTTAAPINIYYKSLRGQMVYHASELLASGIVPGSLLTHFGFYVEGAPLYDIPNFIVRMKHTTAADVAAHDNGPFDLVYSNPAYMPVAGGWDILELDEPFIWDGESNILVDTAFSLLVDYNASGIQRVYTVTNGFRFARSDTADQTNVTTTTTSTNKPQAIMMFGPPAAYMFSMVNQTGNLSVEAGMTDTYEIAITNLGTAEDVYTLEYAPVSRMWDYVLSDETVVVQPGTTEIVTLVVTVPVDAVLGDFDAIVLTADSFNEPGLSRSVTITTYAIAPIVPPYLENFDGTWVGTPPAPLNWMVIDADADGYTWSQGNIYISPTHSEPYAAHGMGNNNDWLITPLINLVGNTTLSWWDKVESVTYPNTYTVYLSTTSNDIADFTIDLGTYNCTNTAWTEHTIDLSLYTGQTVYLAFHQTFSGSTYWGFGIDDFQLTLEMAELDAPVVTIEVVGGNVELSWDAVAGANSYLVYSSDDPYAIEWDLVTHIGGTVYSEAVVGMKHYKVVASSATAPILRGSASPFGQPGTRR